MRTAMHDAESTWRPEHHVNFAARHIRIKRGFSPWKTDKEGNANGWWDGAFMTNNAPWEFWGEVPQIKVDHNYAS